MKVIILFLFLFATIFGFSQTATDFSCNNCSGQAHSLFNELDAGKVVVLVWVMPCGSCVLPAKTAYNVSQSYSTSNPGKVVYYLCDDYGTTSCSSMDSWANTNNISESVRFSNLLINMADYGESGMPKMVVLSGSDHKVYDNQINSFDARQIQDAIDLAISESSNGINENTDITENISIVFDKLSSSVFLNISATEPLSIELEIYNGIGQIVISSEKYELSTGENKIRLSPTTLSSGLYILSITKNNSKKSLKFIVY